MFKTSIHNNLPFQIETLTPIHIGTGEVVASSQLEYIDKNLCALVDLDQYIDNKTSHIQDMTELKKVIEILTSEIENGLGIPKSEIITLRKINANKEAFEFFKEHISLDFKQYHQLYIPGSSLKGSIKTALISSNLLRKPRWDWEKEMRKKENSEIYNFRRRKFPDYEIGVKNSIGRSAQQDSGRLFQIPDINFKSTYSSIQKCVTANWLKEKNQWSIKEKESKNDFQNSLENWLECIPEGEIGIGKLNFAQSLKAELSNRSLGKGFEKMKQVSNQIATSTLLFKVINEQTKRILKAEMDFLSDKLDAKDSEVVENYFSQIQSISNQIPSTDSDYCILRLGHGSGFRFITGYWQKEKMPLQNRRGESEWNGLTNLIRGKKYQGYDFPKTVKMLENGMPLGFIKIQSR